MKFKDILPLIFGVDYIHIEYCGELFIYDCEYDTKIIKEYGEYYVHGISDCSPSYEGALYFRLEREPWV